MGLANYAVIEHGKTWTVLHDGETNGDFATKEAAFESAVSSGFSGGAPWSRGACERSEPGGRK